MSSFNVETTFGSSVTRAVCNDIGSDIHLRPLSLFTALLARETERDVTVLAAPRKFWLAAGTSKIDENLFVECARAVQFTIDLHTPHGKVLKIRDLFWFVALTKKLTENPVLGLPLLEALGRRTKEILEAACDKYSRDVDANDFVPEHMNIWQSISHIVQSEIFHSEDHKDIDKNAQNNHQAFRLISESELNRREKLRFKICWKTLRHRA